MEAAVERIVVQATPQEKKAIAAKAKRLGLPRPRRSSARWPTPPRPRPIAPPRRSTTRSPSSRRATGASRRWRRAARTRRRRACARPPDGPDVGDRPGLGRAHLDDQARGQGDAAERGAEGAAVEDREPDRARDPPR